MKSDVEKARGKQMSSASNEVITVPAINGMAPYDSLPSVGFQSVENINPNKPNSLNAGIAPLIIEYAIPAKMSNIITDEVFNRFLMIFSLPTLYFYFSLHVYFKGNRMLVICNWLVPVFNVAYCFNRK